MQLSFILNEINILLSARKVNAHLESISFCTERTQDLHDIQKEDWNDKRRNKAQKY